jgi:hypothetical protein
MAILKNIIAAAVLASSTLAVPLGLEKRDLVVNTVTKTDWVTVQATAVVWVDDNGKPVSTETPSVAGAVTAIPTTSSSATTAAAVVVVSSGAPHAAPPAPAPVASSSSSSAPAPTYSPAGFAEQPSPSPSTSWAASSAAPAPAPSSTVMIQQKSSGTCEGPGSGCSGDITHYDGGLGACGWNVNTASDMQIALPYALMGTQSNGNPYCGRSLTIVGTSGNKVQATVGDKCMGCTGNSIDLTNALFSAVAPNGDGRVSGITWYFN